jgi:hypothetical protein
MASSVEQQLLGYLLGALDDSERETVETKIQRDAQLRAKLVELRGRLGPLRHAENEFDPPLGLAQRTCEFVAAYAATHAEPATAPLAALHSPEDAPAVPPIGLWGGVKPWGWSDFSVATGVVIAAILLVFPAIENSRFRTQLLTCQDHLRQLGQALTGYSSRHGGFFPQVPQQGTLAAAGIYAPVLLGDGYLDDKRWVLCPGSILASDSGFQVPQLEQLQKTAGTELVRLRGMMGGSYGYSLGYVEDGRYHPTRNLSRPQFALMADAPTQTLPDHQSNNHGGRGQNVLFEDGHVRFLTAPRPADPGDDFFVNDTGLVAPGMHRNDSVIGSSDTPPVVLVNSGQ